METVFLKVECYLVFQFKSYYVVWKRKKYEMTQENKKSLNRTM